MRNIKLENMIASQLLPVISIIMGGVILLLGVTGEINYNGVQIGSNNQYINILLIIVGIILLFKNLFDKGNKYKIKEKNINKIFKGSGIASVVEIDVHEEDFKKNRKTGYSFEEAKITISTNNIHLNTSFIANDPDGSQYLGKIEGDGVIKDGIAFIIYKGTLNIPHASWNGVFIAKISSAGNINGYWMAEDIFMKGKLAFGIAKFIAENK